MIPTGYTFHLLSADERAAKRKECLRELLSLRRKVQGIDPRAPRVQDDIWRIAELEQILNRHL